MLGVSSLRPGELLTTVRIRSFSFSSAAIGLPLPGRSIPGASCQNANLVNASKHRHISVVASCVEDQNSIASLMLRHHAAESTLDLASRLDGMRQKTKSQE